MSAKRFVIVCPPNSRLVSRIVEVADTKEAAALCDKIHKETRGKEVASWVKAASLEDLAEVNPYVKIHLLELEIYSLKQPAQVTLGPVGDEEVAQPTKDPKKFWSNGKPRK